MRVAIELGAGWATMRVGLHALARSLSGSIQGVEIGPSVSVILGEAVSEIVECADEQGMPLFEVTPDLERAVVAIFETELQKQLDRAASGSSASLAGAWRDSAVLAREYIRLRCAEAGARPARRGQALSAPQAAWKTRKYAALSQSLVYRFTSAGGGGGFVAGSALGAGA